MNAVIRRVANYAVVLAVGAAPALAQQSPAYPPELNTEQNPLRNVSGGALRNRAPGNMVSAGVARTVIKANEARGVIEITEEAPGPDPKAVFLAEAVEIIFEQINQAVLLFENVLRLRAGLPPRVPIDLAPSDSDTTDDDTDTDNDVQDILDDLQ